MPLSPAELAKKQARLPGWQPGQGAYNPAQAGVGVALPPIPQMPGNAPAPVAAPVAGPDLLPNKVQMSPGGGAPPAVRTQQPGTSGPAVPFNPAKFGYGYQGSPDQIRRQQQEEQQANSPAGRAARAAKAMGQGQLAAINNTAQNPSTVTASGY